MTVNSIINSFCGYSVFKNQPKEKTQENIIVVKQTANELKLKIYEYMKIQWKLPKCKGSIIYILFIIKVTKITNENYKHIRMSRDERKQGTFQRIHNNKGKMSTVVNTKLKTNNPKS